MIIAIIKWIVNVKVDNRYHMIRLLSLYNPMMMLLISLILIHDNTGVVVVPLTSAENFNLKIILLFISGDFTIFIDNFYNEQIIEDKM